MSSPLCKDAWTFSQTTQRNEAEKTTTYLVKYKKVHNATQLRPLQTKTGPLIRAH